ncbi:MAG: hypothetical protein RBG13Loki_4319 [Promethearchaeota archaeon CR_4]|nr:MAG: hypothetical protein RBG13Loki_4319 [Candidatus Lokiarchaeota archaeon CR_4]
MVQAKTRNYNPFYFEIIGCYQTFRHISCGLEWKFKPQIWRMLGNLRLILELSCLVTKYLATELYSPPLFPKNKKKSCLMRKPKSLPNKDFNNLLRQKCLF